MKGMQKQMEDQVGQSINTETTGVLWTCFVLYLLVSACGAASLALPGLLSGMAPRAAQPGAGAPEPPAAPPEPPR